MRDRLQPGNCLAAAAFIGTILCNPATVFSQQKGRLHLEDFSPAARVYVDAVPARADSGDVLLSPGRHRIQAEMRNASGLYAYRRIIRITPRRTTTMLLVWHRVQVYTAEEAKAYKPLPPGPAGKPGPPAHAYEPFPPNADLALLESSLHLGRNILIDDYEVQMDDMLNSLYPFARPIYVYIKTPSRASRADPPQSPGPQGPPGPAGIDAKVKLILTPTGEPVFGVMAERLGLIEIQQTLKTLRSRIANLAKTPSGRIREVSEPLQILTPEWRSALDREWNEHAASRPGLPMHWDRMEEPGARGRRGPDGVPPAEAAPIRLTGPDEKQLLEMLTTGDFLRASVKHLREKLAELKQRVYLAEGAHLEQFPPPSLRRSRKNLRQKPRRV